MANATVPCDGLLGVLHGQRPAVVEIDLAGVTVPGRAGICAHVPARNAAVKAGCQLRISDPQPIVRRVLAVTGLLGSFTAPIAHPLPPPARPEHPAEAGPPSLL